jgi:hypothetical protein
MAGIIAFALGEIGLAFDNERLHNCSPGFFNQRIGPRQGLSDTRLILYSSPLQKNPCQGYLGLQLPEKGLLAARHCDGFLGGYEGLLQIATSGQGFCQKSQVGCFRLQAELVLLGLRQSILE